MLKQRFLKNSARVLTVSTVLLFISNAIVWATAENPSLETKLGFLIKLPDLSVYIFTFLSYLALNDEKAAHRKIKDIKSQKKLKLLKGFLIFVFVSYFFKGIIQSGLSSINTPFFSIVSDLFMTVASFSFFLMLLSLWYFFRDKNEGKLKLVTGLSVVVSFFYTVCKFSLSRKVFPLHSFSGAEDNGYIIVQRVQYAACLIQYAVNIVMLVVVKKHYEKKEMESEEIEKNLPKQERPQVVTIELEDSFGIDNIDDYDFSYENTEAEMEE